MIRSPLLNNGAGPFRRTIGDRREDAVPGTAGNSRPGQSLCHGRSPGLRVLVESGSLPGGSTHQWPVCGLPTRRLQLREQLRL